MDVKPPRPVNEEENRGSQPRALRDLLLVASPIGLLGITGNAIGLHTLSGAIAINLGYVLAIVVGYVVLKRQGSSWCDIGLGKPTSWFRTICLGIGACIGAVVVFVAMQILVVGILTALGMAPPELDQSRFNPLLNNLPLFILMLVLAWTTISFGEELFYRAFLISRLMDQTALGKWRAILISGIVFGASHFAEGPLGFFSNGAFGFLFGWIYLRSGRNLWITIIGHGLINTFRFVLLYTGAA